MASAEFDRAGAERNLKALAENPYPGRGIILGRSQDSDEAVQVYWVMGRSENSRNRVLVEDKDTKVVRTEAFDESKVEDPSLIIYNAMRPTGSWNDAVSHVVSNGDQTDTAYYALNNCPHYDNKARDSFVTRLLGREYEPDAPNYTARITGAFALGDVRRYLYSIIRRNPTSGLAEHTFGGGETDDIPEGAGICFHTYQGDWNPLPTFQGGPYAVPLGESGKEIAEQVWERLNPENRVALAVRSVDFRGKILGTHIINQLQK